MPLRYPPERVYSYMHTTVTKPQRILYSPSYKDYSIPCLFFLQKECANVTEKVTYPRTITYTCYYNSVVILQLLKVKYVITYTFIALLWDSTSVVA